MIGCAGSHYRIFLTLVAVSLVAEVTPSAGQILSPARDDSRPSVAAVTLEGEITLDGVLSETIWGTAPGIQTLTMIEPLEGAIPTALTLVRLVWTQETRIRTES